MQEKKRNDARDRVEPDDGNDKNIAHSRFCNEVNEQIFKGIAINDIFGAATINYFKDKANGDDHSVTGEDPEGVSSSRDH